MVNKIKRSIQFITTLIYNGSIKGFLKGSIYQGNLKKICIPGLNCYSCPGALFSCPLGALQNAFTVGQIPFYIMGFLLFIGGLLGRFICGWLCPFGYFQDLLSKIPVKKYHIKKTKFTHIKYFVLIIFVLSIPLAGFFSQGLGVPAFCKYICPAGTLEAGIPLTTMNESFKTLKGLLYYWKVILLVIIILASSIVFRPFCRFLCPLGALYGLMNKISLFGITYNPQKCTGCKNCEKQCPMHLDILKDPTSPECIRCAQCIDGCHYNCLSIGKRTGYPQPNSQNP